MTTRVEKVMLGGCVLGERHSRPRQGGGEERRYSGALHRMREVEALVRARFGQTIPREVDALPYVTVIGFAAVAAGDFDRLASVLHGWCACFAPYMIETADDWFEPLRRSLEGRRWNLAAGDVADMLQVCFEERQALGLRTIAACDLDPEEMRACVADARRERERARAAARREAKTSRTEWLASHRQEAERPWEAQGISRRTYFNRKKAGPCTGALQGAQDASCTGALQIGNLPGSAEQPVQPPSIAPTLDDLGPALGGGVSPPIEGRQGHHHDSSRHQPTDGRTPAHAGDMFSDEVKS